MSVRCQNLWKPPSGRPGVPGYDATHPWIKQPDETVEVTRELAERHGIGTV